MQQQQQQQQQQHVCDPPPFYIIPVDHHHLDQKYWNIPLHEFDFYITAQHKHTQTYWDNIQSQAVRISQQVVKSSINKPQINNQSSQPVIPSSQPNIASSQPVIPSSHQTTTSSNNDNDNNERIERITSTDSLDADRPSKRTKIDQLGLSDVPLNIWELEKIKDGDFYDVFDLKDHKWHLAVVEYNDLRNHQVIFRVDNYWDGNTVIISHFNWEQCQRVFPAGSKNPKQLTEFPKDEDNDMLMGGDNKNNNDDDDDDDDDGDDDDDDDESKVWECKNCSFSNLQTAQSCRICNTMRVNKYSNPNIIKFNPVTTLSKDIIIITVNL